MATYNAFYNKEENRYSQCEICRDQSMAAKRQNKISKTEMKELRELFDLFDSDKDGQISGREIERMFQAAGFNPTKRELAEVLKTADADNNNRIDFDEFIQLTKNTKMASTPKEREQELVQAFKTFDKNNDGVIDKRELRAILRLGGEEDPDIDSIMEQFDKNGDGVLQYEEFAALWSASS